MIDKSYMYGSSRVRNYLILFILWPFLAFLVALKNYDQKVARKVIYFYFIYYGLTFVITQVYYVDAAGYTLHLQENAARPFKDFFKIVGGLYSDTTVDIAEPLLSFIVSRFTTFYGVYLAIWAAIFGYFHLKSINLLYDRYKENPGWNARIFLFFFVAILPIIHINSVRMWTAGWIFFFGAYHVIIHREIKYFWLALGAVLVHWSFLTANVILLIYFFAGNRNFIYLPLATISFFLPRLLTGFFRNLSVMLGGSFQSRYSAYTDEEAILRNQEIYAEADWIFKVGYDWIFYYLIISVLAIHYWYKSSIKDKAEENLFSFILLFLTFVNFGKDIPSFGGRFQIIFYLFATVYIFQYYVKRHGDRISIHSLIGLFPMTFYSAIVLRQGTESISVWLLTPGLGLALLGPSISIAGLLFN